MFILILAKSLDVDPHRIPPGVPLEDWFAQSFNIVGPLPTVAEAVEIADRLEEGRYWAALEISDKPPA